VDGSGNPFLEKSTTVYATHTDGTVIKSGDPTRALVGIAGSNSSGAWEDTPTNRLVRSFFNRQSQPMYNRYTANRTTTAVTASPAEPHTEIRVNFVCFPDDLVEARATGYMFNSSATEFTYCSVTYDGVSTSFTNFSGITCVYGTAGGSISAGQNSSGLSAGRHYATLAGSVTGGTGTYGGGVGNTPSTILHAKLV
jgi:hypothetical protein